VLLLRRFVVSNLLYVSTSAFRERSSSSLLYLRRFVPERDREWCLDLERSFRRRVFLPEDCFRDLDLERCLDLRLSRFRDRGFDLRREFDLERFRCSTLDRFFRALLNFELLLSFNFCDLERLLLFLDLDLLPLLDSFLIWFFDFTDSPLEPLLDDDDDDDDDEDDDDDDLSLIVVISDGSLTATILPDKVSSLPSVFASREGEDASFGDRKSAFNGGVVSD